MEIFIEEQIRLEFPNINLHCNTISAIGIELDFYFPELRFAIELNGIFHYKPIYGDEKLKRVQEKDRQKIIRCIEEGIELLVIDVSERVYLTQERKEKYWQTVKELVTSF